MSIIPAQKSAPTFCVCVADEICASPGFQLGLDTVPGEGVEQGSVLALRQQGAADGRPQGAQLAAVSRIKVLEGEAGGRMLGTCGRLPKSRETDCQDQR